MTKIRNAFIGAVLIVIALVVIVPHLGTSTDKGDTGQVVYTWTYGDIKPEVIRYFDEYEHERFVDKDRLPAKKFTMVVPFRRGTIYHTRSEMDYHGELSGVTLSCQVAIRGIPQEPRSLNGTWGIVHCGPYGPF